MIAAASDTLAVPSNAFTVSEGFGAEISAKSSLFTYSTGIPKCLKKDIDSLTIVPYFLYPGRKVKIAVTEVMKYQKDTKVKFVVTKQMSMHKTLVDVVGSRIDTTLKENNISLSNNEVDVMIIGHGSKDPNAQMSLDYIVNNLKDSYRNVSRCWLEIEQPDIFKGIKKM